VEASSVEISHMTDAAFDPASHGWAGAAWQCVLSKNSALQRTLEIFSPKVRAMVKLGALARSIATKRDGNASYWAIQVALVERFAGFDLQNNGGSRG
jgi:hypothetical protein